MNTKSNVQRSTSNVQRANVQPYPGRLFRHAPAEREAIVDALAVALRAEPDVVFAYVHGSFVTERPFRDVDVGVHLAPEAEGGWERQMRLAETLEEAVASSPGLGAALPVDVRVLNRAPLGFCYQVLRRGELVFSRDEALRVRWVARIVGLYLDLKPLRVQALKEAMTA